MADDHENNPEAEVDIQFKPVIELPPVEIDTLEDDEEEIFKMRAKLFRLDNLSDPPQMKERGVGDIRILQNRTSKRIRFLMRRDKVLKICCNHFLTKTMKLKAHASSDRAFVWTTMADFADEEPKPEVLAIRFRDSDHAQKFKKKFEELQENLPDVKLEKKKVPVDNKEEKENTKPDGDYVSTDDVTTKLNKLKVGGEGAAGDN